MWTPTTAPSLTWTSLISPAVLRILLLPLPARLYFSATTLSAPYSSLAFASVMPTEATSGWQYVTRGTPS